MTWCWGWYCLPCHIQDTLRRLTWQQQQESYNFAAYHGLDILAGRPFEGDLGADQSSGVEVVRIDVLAS